jgi:hypothetical protein
MHPLASCVYCAVIDLYCPREMYCDKVCIDLLVLWNIYDKMLFGKKMDLL